MLKISRRFRFKIQSDFFQRFRRVEKVEMGDFPEEEGKRKKDETEQGST